MKRLILAAVIMFTGACGSDSDNGTGVGDGDDSMVNIGDNFFNPQSANVPIGTEVTWTWTGGAPHNVTFDDNSLTNSSTQNAGIFAQTFDSAGTFTYFCAVHGRAVMSGEVMVTSN